MPEIGIHQGDDGFEDFQSLPSSDEVEIDSDEEERNMEPQSEGEDVRNSGGLRKRKMKSSRPEDDVWRASELGNGEETSSRSGKELDGGVTPDLATFYYLTLRAIAAIAAWEVLFSVPALLLFLCSRSFSGELYVNQHEVSKDLHQTISEMRIVETPLHSVRSVAQDGKWVFKMARHDFLLLRTAGDKWYKAEKHGPSSGQAGIHFYPVTGPGAATIRFRSNISVDFSLAQALDILTDHKLDYSLWRENCWKYAHSRAEAILNSCIEVASDEDMRSELKKELENLMDTRRRMPNEVVDVVQDYNIFRGLVFYTTLELCCFLLGFREDLLREDLFSDKQWAVSGLWIFYSFRRDPNPILLTYNLTWLATTYRWPFHFLPGFLSFFGYCVGFIVLARGLDFFLSKSTKYSTEYPFLRTGFSERGDLAITISRANSHQDNSIEDQRKYWQSRFLIFGIRVVVFVRISEAALGYSNITGLSAFLSSFFVSFWISFFGTKMISAWLAVEE